jgi:hypothetical protein
MKRFRVFLPCITLALIFNPAKSFSQDHLSDGDQWLKWGDETRIAYVAGFFWGYERGYFEGCDVGEQVYAKKRTGRPGEKCTARMSKQRIKSPEEYAELVTNYYRTYPADRYVDLLELLEGLQRDPNLRIQDMHKHYPPHAKHPA